MTRYIWKRDFQLLFVLFLFGGSPVNFWVYGLGLFCHLVFFFCYIQSNQFFNLLAHTVFCSSSHDWASITCVQRLLSNKNAGS